MSHRTRYSGQRLFSSKVVARQTNTNAHTGPIALHGPLRWPRKNPALKRNDSIAEERKRQTRSEASFSTSSFDQHKRNFDAYSNSGVLRGLRACPLASSRKKSLIEKLISECHVIRQCHVSGQWTDENELR